jgi:hypothetical protein
MRLFGGSEHMLEKVPPVLNLNSVWHCLEDLTHTYCLGYCFPFMEITTHPQHTDQGAQLCLHPKNSTGGSERVRPEGGGGEG